MEVTAADLAHEAVTEVGTVVVDAEDVEDPAAAVIRARRRNGSL